jgi:hypothetical protein
VSLSVRPVRGTGSSEKRSGWFFSFWQQWSSLIGRCNWYDFTLIQVSGEFAPYTDRWEFELGLLGFHMNIQYVYKEMPPVGDLLREIEAEYAKADNIKPASGEGA